ncbi:hypothetical protein J2W42_006620 [Rhizobium tibeticum]|uniref:hypothetical protein n=1 Tax=Rhizobium tibeticum TaxID=501024 RepID=UPI002785600D|nr:hypothetical protein [Rhizobium tibeticum]MDP9813745.1 hypothetical protein [Rhizobium tibeticum]
MASKDAQDPHVRIHPENQVDDDQLGEIKLPVALLAAWKEAGIEPVAKTSV